MVLPGAGGGGGGSRSTYDFLTVSTNSINVSADAVQSHGCVVVCVRPTTAARCSN